MRGCRGGGGSSWKWEPELAAREKAQGRAPAAPRAGGRRARATPSSVPGTRRVPAQRRWDAGPKEEVRKALGGRAALRAAPLLDCGSQE